MPNIAGKIGLEEDSRCFFSLWLPSLTKVAFISWHNFVEKHIPVLRCSRCGRHTRHHSDSAQLTSVTSSQWLSKQQWRVSYLMQKQPPRLQIYRRVHTSGSWCLGRRMKSVGDFTFRFNPAFFKFLLPIEKCCSVVPHMHLKWLLNTWGKMTFSQCVKVVVWEQNNMVERVKKGK